MKVEDLEPVHRNGRPHANHRDNNAKRHTKPAKRAMQRHFANAYKGRLRNEENYPAEEHCAMEVKHPRTNRHGVNEAAINRSAETSHYGSRHDKRHQEVEVAINQAVALDDAGSGPRNGPLTQRSRDTTGVQLGVHHSPFRFARDVDTSGA